MSKPLQPLFSIRPVICIAGAQTAVAIAERIRYKLVCGAHNVGVHAYFVSLDSGTTASPAAKHKAEATLADELAPLLEQVSSEDVSNPFIPRHGGPNHPSAGFVRHRSRRTRMPRPRTSR